MLARRQAILGAVEIVAHEEAAAQQVLAQLFACASVSSQWPTSTAYSQGQS